MTSAEYRQLHQKQPATPTKPPQRGVTAGAAVGGDSGAVLGLAGKQSQHYVGPYALQVANGTHYPGRSRIVVVGPASEELTAALVAALESFTAKQPKP